MMLIKCEFESLSEMKAFARELIGCECNQPQEEPKKTLTAEELAESAKVTEEIINRAEAREAEEKEAPTPEPKKEEPEAPAPASTVTETQITTLLAKKIKEGKKAEVKDLFSKYGVTKKSELLEKHPDKFDEIYAAVEAL